MTIRTTDKLACVKRELMRRRRHYPAKVARRRMTALRARREIMLMAAIVEDYCAAVGKEASLSSLLPGMFHVEKTADR
jgi:hypothetical protein